MAVAAPAPDGDRRTELARLRRVMWARLLQRAAPPPLPTGAGRVDISVSVRIPFESLEGMHPTQISAILAGVAAVISANR
jgi:hypothetical protein